MKKLDPKCLKGEMQAALTNRGELIPCCYCDTQRTLADPEFQKLLKVSKIKDYDTIEEIYLTKEWIEFVDNLKNNKGPWACWRTCEKRDNDDLVRKETFSYKCKVTYENKV